MTGGFIYDAATAAQTIQMVNEWNEQRKDASAWQSRNSQEYAAKLNYRSDKEATGRLQKQLADQKVDLENRVSDTGRKSFRLAYDRAGTDNRVDQAITQAQDDAAGVAGRSLDEFEDYSQTLTARANEYVDEAKAFTDPLLAAAPGSTVKGNRFTTGFQTAASADPDAVDPRKAELAAYSEALSKAPSFLSGIDIAQSGLNANMENIQRKEGLERSDQNYAAAGIQDQLANYSREKGDLQKRANQFSLDDLYRDNAFALRMDNIARANPRTLKGQQNPQMPIGNVLSNISRMSWAQPAQPISAPASNYNSSQASGLGVWGA